KTVIRAATEYVETRDSSVMAAGSDDSSTAPSISRRAPPLLGASQARGQGLHNPRWAQQHLCNPSFPDRRQDEDHPAVQVQGMVHIIIHGHKFSLFRPAKKGDGRRGGAPRAGDCFTAANPHAARLWSDGGSNARGGGPLGPNSGWFPGGFGTLDS